jgi:integrase
MALVGLCTGLRVNEILALKWNDVDFAHFLLNVSRGVVRGIVDQVKTEYSYDELPLDPGFALQLGEWKQKCPATAEGWMFPSPVTNRPYEPGTIQQKQLRVAGQQLGLENVGWHTLRHTYRSLLDAAGAPIGVQQKLMRHAQVSTTMNRYGTALMNEKRKANTNVVRMMLKSETIASDRCEIVGFCGVNADAAELGHEE